ncbi:hypothetical protein SVAN01_05646 [Stagonosporopsis vannaccii]|nr:hypothetical protein SVAN01_05646 [Stagonosporopsis vannaccii]
MAKRRAEEASERSRRPARPARDPRVYFFRDRLLHHLRQICPEELTHFPHPSTFTIWKSVVDDPNHPQQEFRSLEIGNVWPTNTAHEAEGMGLQRLFVIDRGAYNGDQPDLVPYTEHGDGQRFIVAANGFAPTGIFQNFRQVLGHQIINPRLDDSIIVSLIQFIFILRDVRRYYSYTAAHDADIHVQLAPIVEAIRVATIGSRLATRTLHPPWNDIARPGVPHPQGMMDPRMNPELAAKSYSFTATDGSAAHTGNTIGHGGNDHTSSTTSIARRNGYNSFVLVHAHGTTASEALGNSTITEAVTSDHSIPDESTPAGTGHGSSTSPPSNNDDGSL